MSATEPGKLSEQFLVVTKRIFFNFCISSSDIWLPEISVVDLVDVARLDLNEERGELKVRGDKTINLIHRMKVKIQCQLDLKMFPHDYQVILSLYLDLMNADYYW